MIKWLDDRLYLSRFQKKFLRKAFPVHNTFYLGEIALFSFVILVLTGIFLSINFEPSTRIVEVNGQELPAAYASVQFIDSLPFGKVIRSMHHWSAHIMVAAAFLHLLRVLVTGSYKRPREINWILGILLLAMSIVAAFTGYALPYDAFSAAAANIGFQIGSSIPLIGPWIANVVFGGVFPTELSLPRLNALHILWIPLVIGGLLAAHMVIMVLQKHTQPKYAEKVAPGKILGVPMWPQQLLTMAIVFSVLTGSVAILSAVFIANPIEVYGPPRAAMVEMKPDWFLLWVYGFLQLIPTGWGFTLWGVRVGPQFLGLVVPIAVVVYSLVFPLIGASRTNVPYLELPSRHPWRTGSAVGVLGFFMAATLAAYKNDLGLGTAFLWIVIIVTPLVFTVVTALLIQAATRRSRGRSAPDSSSARPAPVVDVRREVPVK
jgi:cytochrome b-561